MRNKIIFFFVLLFFFSVFFVKLGRGQKNRRSIVVNVGVVTDVGTSYSDVAMLCINMSLVDFYSCRPQFQKRLVVNVGDSTNDLDHQVYIGRYDVVVGDTTILANRSSDVYFTFPFIESGVELIVSTEDLVKRELIYILKRPLSWKLWLTSFVCFFFTGVTVWIVEHSVNQDYCGLANYQVSTMISSGAHIYGGRRSLKRRERKWKMRWLKRRVVK
ncbi:unnamed protein product [Microthlaspi erraticum]|uniref:Solute-binding protein family 3/N-terminal domain-containing protein n=1 Tax=Microthlaspi erraticum TaxID=1685480 RepID=A0A6D2J0I5_9BRAS|nr:unnamed protein product [Microthlaspi erraticum]